MKKLILNLALSVISYCLPLAGDSSLDVGAILIDSELVNYNGKTLNLQGNVVIKHPLGVYSAGHVVLFSDDESKKNSFGLLKLNDNVKLSFKDGGQLCCAIAELDHRNMNGKFFGNELQEFVVYTEKCTKKASETVEEISLKVKSRNMTVDLVADKPSGEALAKNSIAAIKADDQVTVSYNDDLVVSADHAVYQRAVVVGPDSKGSTLFPGFIKMYAEEKNGLCQVSDSNGDLIEASEICIDTIKRMLVFSKPNGSLESKQSMNLGRVNFSANRLEWDEPAGSFVLQDQVSIDQNGIGKIETPKQLKCLLDVKADKKVLKSIDSPFDTTLTYRDVDKKIFHRLFCSGPVNVDLEKMETRLMAFRNNYGTIDENKQIHFKDSNGEVFADRVLIKYSIDGHSLIVNKIVLAGNVRVINNPAPDDEVSSIRQYILADRVDFTPQANEMIFRAIAKGHRVLFYDKINSLQVSAPAIKINRDKATKKDAIKGIGDVRFSFVESEFAQLRRRFMLEKSES